MSGWTGYCIACGAFHATGHMGDNYRAFSMDGLMAIACPDCIPYAPRRGTGECSKCGKETPVELHANRDGELKQRYPVECHECQNPLKQLEKRVAELEARNV
jgi:DNA-directed RNA polymerase subunit RPC12/RpoP